MSEFPKLYHFTPDGSDSLVHFAIEYEQWDIALALCRDPHFREIESKTSILEKVMATNDPVRIGSFMALYATQQLPESEISHLEDVIRKGNLTDFCRFLEIGFDLNQPIIDSDIILGDYILPLIISEGKIELLSLLSGVMGGVANRELVVEAPVSKLTVMELCHLQSDDIKGPLLDFLKKEMRQATSYELLCIERIQAAIALSGDEFRHRFDMVCSLIQDLSDMMQADTSRVITDQIQAMVPICISSGFNDVVALLDKVGFIQEVDLRWFASAEHNEEMFIFLLNVLSKTTPLSTKNVDRLPFWKVSQEETLHAPIGLILLHVAIEYGFLDVVRTILASDSIDVNEVIDGQTALQLAAAKDLNISKALLGAKANPFFVNHEGRRAIDISPDLERGLRDFQVNIEKRISAMVNIPILKILKKSKNMIEAMVVLVMEDPMSCSYLIDVYYESKVQFGRTTRWFGLKKVDPEKDKRSALMAALEKSGCLAATKHKIRELINRSRFGEVI
ncbi:MAG: ankyrin repeat domain-containing protein [Candidatus Margulisbacteria bacterium]|nr:ankyrin repeat domain-containing protein [Candidatus Margulisiibacteriota bacterium]